MKKETEEQTESIMDQKEQTMRRQLSNYFGHLGSVIREKVGGSSNVDMPALFTGMRKAGMGSSNYHYRHSHGSKTFKHNQRKGL